MYRNYPKNTNISTLYHTYSKIWTHTISYPMLCLKLVDEWQSRPWWDAAFCGVSSGSTMFAQSCLSEYTLRKHAYSNITIILPAHNEMFQIKNSDIFHISAQNIDCGHSFEPPRRGGSNEYHNLCFLAEINNVYPCKPPVLLYKSWV